MGNLRTKMNRSKENTEQKKRRWLKMSERIEIEWLIYIYLYKFRCNCFSIETDSKSNRNMHGVCLYVCALVMSGLQRNYLYMNTFSYVKNVVIYWINRNGNREQKERVSCEEYETEEQKTKEKNVNSTENQKPLPPGEHMLSNVNVCVSIYFTFANGHRCGEPKSPRNERQCMDCRADELLRHLSLSKSIHHCTGSPLADRPPSKKQKVTFRCPQHPERPEHTQSPFKHIYYAPQMCTRINLTRLHGLCSAMVADETLGPLLMIACESCIGFIGGGNSNVASSSASNSPAWWPLLLLAPLVFGWTVADVVGNADLLLTDGADAFDSSSAVIDAANLSADASLNVFSEPFFTSGRSAALVFLSTFPWDNFRSGGGNHFRLKSENWKKEKKKKIEIICRHFGGASFRNGVFACVYASHMIS